MLQYQLRFLVETWRAASLMNIRELHQRRGTPRLYGETIRCAEIYKAFSLNK